MLIFKRILFFIGVAIIFSSCAIKGYMHESPEIRGKTIDLQSMQPVVANVSLPEYGRQSTSNNDGEFTIDAVTDTKYFRLMMPSSYGKLTRIVATQNGEIVSYNWVLHESNGITKQSDPPVVDIAMIVLPVESEKPVSWEGYRDLDNEYQYAVQVMLYLNDNEVQESFKEIIRSDPDPWLDTLSFLRSQVDEATFRMDLPEETKMIWMEILDDLFESTMQFRDAVR